MGGTLVVNDNPEGGSIFSFTIPLPETSLTSTVVKNDKKIATLRQGLASPRVLVVEDDINSRELLIAMLKNAGIDTRGAENGKIALDIYAQWRPQFIWMDMRMPVMDGYEATRRIRTFRDDNVVIVALTASAFTEDRQLILEAGCDDILTKPFQTEKIFELMQHFLQIEFDYEESAIVVAEKSHQCLDLSILSHAQLQQLHDYAVELEYEDVQHLIEVIQSQHPDTAKELEQLLDNFRFDQIIALCESQLDTSTP
jgi:CheY-like chemotaxis protein